MIKKLARDVAVYGLGDLVVKAIAFIQMPVYTKLLLFSPGEIGLWGSVISVVGLISAFTALGMDSAYALYFFEKPDIESQRRATSTAIWFTLALTTFVMLVLSIFSAQLAHHFLDDSRHGWLLLTGIWLVPLQLVHSLGGQVLRNQMRPRLFVAFNLLSTIASVGSGLLIVCSGGGRVQGVLIGAVIALALMLPVRLWYIRDLFRPVIDVLLLKKMLAYGLPLVIVALAYWITGQSSRLVILKMRGDEESGLFSTALNLTVVLSLANGAIGQAWSPHAFKAYQESPDRANHFFGRVLTLILAGFGLLCVGFCVFGREGLLLLTKPQFLPAESAILPMALGAYALASTQVTAIGISIMRQTHYLAWFAWVAAGVFVLVSLWAVPRWGFVGCAWAGCVANSLLTLIYAAKSRQLLRIAYQWRRALLLVGLTVAGCGMARLLPPGISFTNELFKSGYCLLLAVALGLVAWIGQARTNVGTAMEGAR